MKVLLNSFVVNVHRDSTYFPTWKKIGSFNIFIIMRFPKNVKICALYMPYDETNVLIKNNKIYKVKEAKFIQLLADILKFNFTIDYAKDDHTGQLSSDGNWTGLIGMVKSKECDLAIDAIGITKERNKVVNFSYPYYSADVTFLTNMPEELPKSLAMFYPFSHHVWTACFTVFFFMSLMFYIADYKKGQVQSYQNILLKMFSLLMNQSYDVNVKSRATKVLLVSWIFGTLFLTFFYKATYLSFLSFLPTKGIRSIDDLSKAVMKGTHRCMTYAGSFFIDVLFESPDDTIKVIGEYLKENVITLIEPYDYFSTLKGEKGAFIASKPYLAPLQGVYFLSQDVFFQEMFGIAIAETFCCKSTLDKAIRRICEMGFYDKFWKEKAFFASLKYSSLNTNSKEEWSQLSLEDFVGAFICLGMGTLVSLTVLLIEIILHRFRMN